jgi:hypothetical protein
MGSDIQLDRRGFITGTAALAFGGAVPASLSIESGSSLAVCDRKLAVHVDVIGHRGDILWIDGDVTSVWWTALRPLWAAGGARVAGITNAPALFCLEQLARGAGHRVIVRRPLNASGGIAWIIAPTSSRGLT